MGVLKKPRVSILLYVIVVLFNLSSWIDVSGVFAELPFLVPKLPEGWALPSHISVSIQLATIGPVIYFIANTVKPGVIKEYVAVYTVVTVGFVGCILLVFFWDVTLFIAGAQRSVALLVLTFCLAFTDNTSTIVFLSYFAILPAEYLSAYYIGEAMCGFVPSVASLIQGAGEYDCVNISSTSLVNITSGNDTILANVTEWKEDAAMRDPLFSESVFFGLLAVIMFTSGVSFTLINFHPWFKKFHVKESEPPKKGQEICEISVEFSEKANEINLTNIKSETRCSNDPPIASNTVKSTDALTPSSHEHLPKPFMSTKLYVGLLFQYGYLQAMRYGFLYNIQSYSLLPYGKYFVQYIFKCRSSWEARASLVTQTF